LGCVGCVLKAQQAPKPEKGKWMHRHKSLVRVDIDAVQSPPPF
jgi:hypothetical protein